jgi:hypothetical protein
MATNDAALYNERVGKMRVIDTLPNTGAILKPRSWSHHDHQREDGILDRQYRFEVKSHMDYSALGTLQDVINQYGAAQWQQDNDEYGLSLPSHELCI